MATFCLTGDEQKIIHRVKLDSSSGSTKLTVSSDMTCYSSRAPQPDNPTSLPINVWMLQIKIHSKTCCWNFHTEAGSEPLWQRVLDGREGGGGEPRLVIVWEPSPALYAYNEIRWGVSSFYFLRHGATNSQTQTEPEAEIILLNIIYAAIR